MILLLLGSRRMGLVVRGEGNIEGKEGAKRHSSRIFPKNYGGMYLYTLY
jgi:hypothetical protein